MSKDQDWTVVRMLNWATDYFRDKSIPSPRLSIEWLLSEVLGIRRLDLYMQYDRPLTQEELDALRPLVKRRASHEPLQYITGYTDFYNCRIAVKPGVLIPRPETEQLTEHILREHPQHKLKVLDVGTGSGCIAIALKYERPGWEITGMDNSPEAIETARANAGINGVELNWIKADFTEPVTWNQLPAFDIIVSNPPYIPEDEYRELDPQVREYEPRPALYSDKVEQTYHYISELGKKLLKPQGTFYTELNSRYHTSILSLFNEDCLEAEIIHDYESAPRFLRANFRR